MKDIMELWAAHDQDLPTYGPYNKQYVGFSHAADEARGLRLAVDVPPGLYRRCGTLAERRPPGTETAVLQARSGGKS